MELEAVVRGYTLGTVSQDSLAVGGPITVSQAPSGYTSIALGRTFAGYFDPATPVSRALMYAEQGATYHFAYAVLQASAYQKGFDAYQ